MLAPIVLFAFKRPELLRQTVESLLRNVEASKSDLYVYVDGPRQFKEGEKEKVESVQEYVISIKGFKSVQYTFSEANKGLAQSIITGTTEVLNKYGKVIVLEDDLILSSSFLQFMNEMLEKYESDERIMQVSGFGCKLSRLGNYPYDAYLNKRAQSWSWGTWKNRWESVDWDVRDYNVLLNSKRLQIAFNSRGSDLFGMLKGYMEGRNNSWYIRFMYSMFKQHRFCLTPVKSLVNNEGFGADATNCFSYNRYKTDFEIEHSGGFYVPNYLETNNRIMNNAIRYWQIPYRVYGKFMNLLIKYGYKC